MIDRLDAGEEREPTTGEQPHLAGEPSVHEPGEHEAASEERARARDLEPEQAPEALVRDPPGERLAAPGEPVEVLLGEVDPAAVEVTRDVLPEVRQLERGADLVRTRLALRVPVAEEREHDAADRVGRRAAVGDDVGEGREAAGLAGGVAAERGEELAQRLDRQREKDRILGRRGLAGAGEELRFPRREALEAPLVDPFVRQIVRAARERIDGREVVAERPGQEPGADGEVLVVRAGDARAVRVGRRQAGRVDAREGRCCDPGAHAASAPGRPYSRRWFRIPAKTKSPVKSAGGVPPSSPPRTRCS